MGAPLNGDNQELAKKLVRFNFGEMFLQLGRKLR
jgi:hypothetical protein